MSSVNNRKKNNTNKNNKGNGNLSSKLGLGSFNKDFPEVAKMGAKVQSNFMRMANNKYFLYIMLFLGISTILGFLSVRNFNAVILFVVVAFAMRYFTKNMGIIMLVAVILSNIISVKSTIEGMENGKRRKSSDKRAKLSEGMALQKDGSISDDDNKRLATKKEAIADKHEQDNRARNDKVREPLAEPMAPIDYKMSKDVEVDEDDDDDAIDVQSTQQAAYNNLNKLIGDGGFAKMTKDTEKLMSQQENLAKAMESIGPLVQNAEKMMQGLNLDKFTGMLDKLNGMMGTGGAALKGASS